MLSICASVKLPVIFQIWHYQSVDLDRVRFQTGFLSKKSNVLTWLCIIYALSFDSACLYTLICLNPQTPSTVAVYWFLSTFLHERYRNLQSSLVCSPPTPTHSSPLLLSPPSSSQAVMKGSASPTVRRAGSPRQTSSRSPMSTWGGETSESATESCRLRAWSPRPTPLTEIIFKRTINGEKHFRLFRELY